MEISEKKFHWIRRKILIFRKEISKLFNPKFESYSYSIFGTFLILISILNFSKIPCHPKMEKIFFEFIFGTKQSRQKFFENFYFSDFLGIKSEMSHSSCNSSLRFLRPYLIVKYSRDKWFMQKSYHLDLVSHA